MFRGYHSPAILQPFSSRCFSSHCFSSHCLSSHCPEGCDLLLRVSAERFDELVAEAIDTMPPEFAELLDNVFVVVEEAPSAEDLVALGMHPREADELLGLYQGTPIGERGTEYVDLPDRVVLYRRPILKVCRRERDVRAEVRDTLIHELGHHFGLDDDEMPY